MTGRKMSLMTMILISTIVFLVACDSEKTQGPLSNGVMGTDLVSPRLEEWPNDMANKFAGGGDDIQVDPNEEYRACDGTKSIYTVDPSLADPYGGGYGPTRTAAAEDAVQSAIEYNIRLQFNCQLCQSRISCERFVGEIETGGAFLENPRRDCEFINGEWFCHGPVDFGLDGGGPPASAEGGCKPCSATHGHNEINEGTTTQR